MYAAGRSHPLQKPCQEILACVAAGTVEAVTDVEVHQEIFYRYFALGARDQARDVSEDFLQIVPNVLPVSKADIEKMAGLSRAYPHLQARDLIHLAVMLNHGLDHMASADRGFDSVRQVKRIPL